MSAASPATTLGYDNRNRQISVTDAQGHITSTTYDDASNKTSVTRPGNQPVQFVEYDQVNRRTYEQRNSSTADGLGRSQLILKNPSGHLSLQKNGDGSNKFNVAKEYERKVWYGSTYRNEKYQVEGKDVVTKGDTTAGKGHVHDDRRNGFKSGDWSKIDWATANGVAADTGNPGILGQPVWKALTSDGSVVARLTPQTIPGRTVTETIFSVTNTAAQQIEPPKPLSQADWPDGPPSGSASTSGPPIQRTLPL